MISSTAELMRSRMSSTLGSVSSSSSTGMFQAGATSLPVSASSFDMLANISVLHGKNVNRGIVEYYNCKPAYGKRLYYTNVW